eukprot:m.779184 g.779184  ORF g.779184 m.779184 type:complete len:189 (-) comp23278_c0_seq3:382-948(-)
MVARKEVDADGQMRKQCVGLRADNPQTAEQAADIINAARAKCSNWVAMPKDAPASLAVPPDGDGADTITFGIGFKRKSSMKVGAGLRREGTINLKGNGGKVKRSSESFGTTFASFGSDHPQSAKVEDAKGRAVVQSPPTEPTVAEDEDDDLLDDVDDSLFGHVDTLEEGDEGAQAGDVGIQLQGLTFD